MHFHERKRAMTGAHMYVSDERIWLEEFINTCMGALGQRERSIFFNRILFNLLKDISQAFPEFIGKNGPVPYYKSE